MGKKCIIVGAGSFTESALPLEEGDYVIAADGGLAYLEQLHIRPHMVIGDFDSLGRQPDQGNVVRLPVEKDDTDMGAAIRQGLQKGFDCFYLYGGCGGRMDHTLANIQHLAALTKAGKQAVLFGERQEIRMLKGPGKMVFPPGKKGTVSVLAYSDRCLGVWEKGFQYRLEDYTMESHVPLGVSNAFTGREAVLSVKDGLLLVITDRQGE